MDRDTGPEMARSEYATNYERQQAFLRLFEPQLAPLSRFCRSMCRDDNDAQDLASETVLRAWQHFDRLESTTAFLSFLFTVAVREHRRNSKRRSIWMRLGDLQERETIDPAPPPDAASDLHHLHEALRKLPDKYREAIVLAEIVGMSLSEVAEAQGASLTAVKTRVSRGKRKLATLLGVDEEPRLSSMPPTPRATDSQSGMPGQSVVHPRLAFFSKEKLL